MGLQSSSALDYNIGIPSGELDHRYHQGKVLGAVGRKRDICVLLEQHEVKSIYFGRWLQAFFVVFFGWNSKPWVQRSNDSLAGPGGLAVDCWPVMES